MLNALDLKNVFMNNKEAKIVSYVEALGLGLSIDPNAQRDYIKAKGNGISKYLQNAVINRAKALLGDTSIRGIDCDASFGSLNVYHLEDDVEGKMYIFDGQHRWKGLGLAVEALLNEIQSLKNLLEKEAIKKSNWASRVKSLDKEIEVMELALLLLQNNFYLTIVDFGTVSLEMAQQKFYDVNANATKSSASQNVLFNHKSLWAEMTREIATKFPEYISISPNYKLKNCVTGRKIILLSTLERGIRGFIGGRYSDLDKHNYSFYLDEYSRFLEIFFGSLPDDFFDSSLYIYKDQKVLVALSKYAKSLRVIDKVDWEQTLKRGIPQIDFSSDSQIFTRYGAIIKYGKDDTEKKHGKIQWSGSESGVSIIFKALAKSLRLLDSKGKIVANALDDEPVEELLEEEIIENAILLLKEDDTAKDAEKVLLDRFRIDTEYYLSHVQDLLNLKRKDTQFVLDRLVKSGEIVVTQQAGRKIYVRPYKPAM